MLSHVSKAIVLVHDFINNLLGHLCEESEVREQLWNLIVDQLRDAYRKAIAHARFLLGVERAGRPTTFDYYFKANVQDRRAKRIEATVENLMPRTQGGHGGQNSPTSNRAIKKVANKTSMEIACEDIMDTLVSYYEVSCTRTVDNVCMQAINLFLLDGSESPLKVLAPDVVMGLSDDQLELIAGESTASKKKRKVLQLEIESLEAAVKVLRG